MEKKERKINKKSIIEWFLIILTGIIINVFCVLLFSCSAKAESLYFPMHQNENDHFSSGMLSAIDSQFDSVNNYTFVYTYSFAYGEFYCYALYFPKNDTDPFIFGEINNDGNAFSLYPIQNVSLMKFSINPTTNVIRTYPTAGTNSGNYQNLPSSQYNSNYGYVSNFKIYTNNSKTEVVLKYGSDENLPVGQGHATPPNPFESPTLATGSNYTLPREVPESPTINNYSWTVYNSPTINNSTVESLLESLIDVVKYNIGYMTTNISNEFDNLLTNIKGYFDYTGKTIQYYCGLIISNIQNGIETLYNNMASLVQPIYEKITEFADLFINPFDEEEFEEQIENSSFFTNYNAIIDNCEDISEIFDYAEERDHFSLYISFENPFADSEHKIISSEINFDWLVPLRSVYRPFIWACVLFDLFIGGAKVLSRIIGGHGLG